MFRALFRILSLLSLAMALVSGVLDLSRSIADSAVVFTPLHLDWERFNPGSLESVRQFVAEKMYPFVWDPVFVTLLKSPTWAVFAVLAFLFALGARNRRRRWQESFRD
ncbi:MAG: hypothetical protein KDJ67_06755 [Nitratireductor sp.]|nr:hypothetical protein [Nitratireductor sp.]